VIIRYVLGRPVAPALPKVLKGGKVSTDKRADTTTALYVETCKENGEEPKEEYVAHLADRDSVSWVHRCDMFCPDDLMNSALYDAQQYQRAISKSPLLPPKNAFACEMCSWRSHCEGDPMASGVSSWPNVEEGRAPTELRVKYGRTVRTLSRDRRGFVVSPSELRAFAKCNRLWALEYRWRMRQVSEGPKALSRVRGSLTHAALEMLAKAHQAKASGGKLDGPTSLTVTDLVVELRLQVIGLYDSGQIATETYVELVDDRSLEAMAERAAEMFGLAMADVSEIIEFEQRRIIKMPGSKKWLHGIPDMVVRLKSGRVAVVEYKTTSKTKNLPALADRYRTNPAVHLYAALVRFGQKTF
tara:strand:+ start:8472 stop:9542 length:1071 start_codon:yes stop_codon:yes gene_type:complete